MTSVEEAVRYLTEAVVDIRVDYYVGRGEAPGTWRGRLAAELGLEGTVTAEQLRTIMDGRDPRTDVDLGRRWASQRLVAFDVTFSCPKSVSILYALGDERVRADILAAQAAAVDAVCDYLQEHAAVGRRWNRDTRKVDVVRAEMLFARFVHRTARPVTDPTTGLETVDPHLHTHIPIPTWVRRDDGSWGQLHSAPLYTHAAAAGAVGQAVLRHELVERLGVDVEVSPNGCFDVKGIDARIRSAFSRRTAQVRAAEEVAGVTSLLGHKLAVLGTRESKREIEHDCNLLQEWALRGLDAGFRREDLPGLLGISRVVAGATASLDVAALVGEHGLTAAAATFTRPEVVRAVSAALTQGARREEIEATVDRVLRDARNVVALVPCGAGETADEADARLRMEGREPRYSTPEMVAIEREMLHCARGRLSDRCAVVPTEVVERVIAARPTLTDGQRMIVRAICRDGEGVMVIEGAAGVGKTYALAACREAFESSGYVVAGCALAGRAAQGLEAEAGIPGTTVAAALHRLRSESLPVGSVLVVDEASMVGSRQLAELVALTDRDRAKLVLVGDPAQLQPIDAGAAFRALLDHLPSLAVHETIRQAHLWEREALTALRSGQVDEAVQAYAGHDRIRTSATVGERRCTAVRDLLKATARGEDTVILAHRRAEVARTNSLARAAMEATGRLSGPPVTVRGRELRAGDVVLCTENDRAAGLVNGLRGRVSSVDATAGVIQLDTGTGRPTAIDTSRYDALDHAYAMTAHKAQGLTVDRTLVLAGDGAGREWAYTALSRARSETVIYAVEAPMDHDPEGAGHWRVPTVPVGERLAGAWARAEGKDSTLDLVARWPATDAQLQEAHILPLRPTASAPRPLPAGDPCSTPEHDLYDIEYGVEMSPEP